MANKFVEECEAAGIAVETYQGRFYWKGPAARFGDIDELIDIARATTVRLQWDSPLVYPEQGDSEWYDANIDNPDYNEHLRDEDDQNWMWEE